MAIRGGWLTLLVCAGAWFWGVLALEAPASAATQLDVSVGFNGRVVEGALTPIRIRVQHEGQAVNGRLVITQTVDTPWRGVLTETLIHPLSLGQRANKSLTLYFPVNSIVYPISVWLETEDGDLLSDHSLSLRETGQVVPLTVALSETGFPQTLPTRETVTRLAANEVPDRIEGFESIARVYLGRFSLSALSTAQQNALMRWVMAGGELVLFTGDNWYVQASPVLTPWLPLVPASVEIVTQLNGATFSMVTGETTGVALYLSAQGPGLVQQRLGQGRILMATVDLPALDDSAYTQRIWELLTPSASPATAAGAFESQSQELFAAQTLLFPNRFSLAAILLAFAGGAGVLMWNAMHRPRVGAALLGWVAIACVGLVLMMQLPQYARPLTTVEYGLEITLPDGSSIQRLWYGIFSQRGEQAQLLLPQEAQFRQRIPQERGEHLFDVSYDRMSESAIWLRTQPRQLRAFSGSSTRERALSWSWVENGATLEMFSPVALERTWLLHRGRLLDLGPMEAGQTRRLSLDELPEISAERDLPEPVASFWSWSLEAYNSASLMGGWHEQSQVHPAGRDTQQAYHLLVAEAI